MAVKYDSDDSIYILIIWFMHEFFKLANTLSLGRYLIQYWKVSIIKAIKQYKEWEKKTKIQIEGSFKTHFAFSNTTSFI